MVSSRTSVGLGRTVRKYVGGPFNVDYFFNNPASRRPEGYTDYTQTKKWFAGIVDDIIAFHGSFGPNDKVLDVGCGFGYLIKEFDNRGIECHGVDVSTYAISQAQALFPALSSRFTVVDVVVDPPFSGGNRFDLIVAMGTLDSFTDVQKDLAITWMSDSQSANGKVYMLMDSVNSHYNLLDGTAWELKIGTEFGGLTVSQNVGDQPFLYGTRITNI